MRYLLLGIISYILSIGTIVAGNNDAFLLKQRSEYLIYERYRKVINRLLCAIRFCDMLNLNTKQIAEVFHKTSKSIEETRTRIRQKLGLARDENLLNKLSQI